MAARSGSGRSGPRRRRRTWLILASVKMVRSPSTCTQAGAPSPADTADTDRKACPTRTVPAERRRRTCGPGRTIGSPESPWWAVLVFDRRAELGKRGADAVRRPCRSPRWRGRTYGRRQSAGADPVGKDESIVDAGRALPPGPTPDSSLARSGSTSSCSRDSSKPQRLTVSV